MLRILPFSRFYLILIIWLVMGGLLILLEQLSQPPFSWDTRILGMAYKLSNPTLDRFFQIITWAGSLSFLIPMSISIAWVLMNLGLRNEAWLLSISLIGVTLLTRIVKSLFNRDRPDFYPAIGALPFNDSFPSGHTTQIMAFVIALYIILRRLQVSFLNLYTVLASVLAIIVAYSRIYLQVHYPSDVFAGFVMASLWVLSIVNGLKIKNN